MLFFYRALLCGLFMFQLSVLHVHAGIIANNSAGQTTTAYTNGAANVPVYVWCATSAAPMVASLTAIPTVAGTYTFQWYKHNATNFQWVAYTTSTGATSTINNLANGGYKVEIKTGTTIVECFHVWIWNFIGNASITKTGSCETLSLGATISANDTFTYYNPPAPPSLINSSTQITVCFSATHTWVSDLGFYLVGPASCGSPTITLAPSPGSVCNSGNNVSNLCFSTSSTSNFNVCTASTPLSGTYGYYGAGNTAINWVPLVGCDAAQGGWKVQVYDCYALDVGSLTNASVTFSNLTSVCGSPTSITHSSGTMNSAINDNSCSAATASVFTVPSPFSLPIKKFATRTITWYSPTPGVSFGNAAAPGTSATVPPGTDTIGLNVTYAFGTAQCSLTDDTVIHNNPAPLAAATPLVDTICSQTATSINLTSNYAAATYSWTVVQNGVAGATAGSGTAITQILTATGNTRGFAAYSITAVNNGCPSAVVRDTVFVDPVPTAVSIPSKQNICNGGVTGLSLSSQLAGTTFSWTVSAGTGSVTGASAGTGNSIAQTLTSNTSVPEYVIYTITPSANGCTGNVILDTVIVNPTLTGTDVKILCAGQSYVFNGVPYIANNNTAKDTFLSVYNCDSIVTLNLTVLPYITATRNVTVCQGQSYTFNGITYTTSNTTAKDTVPSATTCDSIITLNLTVLPYITATRNITICQGQSYTFNGITYIASNNTAKDTVPSATTCDSVITLNLTVLPYITATRNVTICQGQSYAFNGIAYTTSNNTAKDTVPSATTCDSIITLNLTVLPLLTGMQAVTICQGQSYTFNGITYTTSNTTAKDTFTSATGCDSIVTLNLNVTPYVLGLRNATICQGQSYTFNGIIYTTSNNTAKDTIPNPIGCDSLVTLNLTVLPALTGVEKRTICFGQSYAFNGTIYTASNNTAKDTLLSHSGCDSIVTLNLTVLPPPDSFVVDTVSCSPLTLNGVTYYESIYATDTLVNQLGCDSFYHRISISIYPQYAFTLQIDTTACNVVLFDGTEYYRDTVLYQLFKTQLGCDSLQRTVNIHVEQFKLDLTASSLMPYMGETITLNTSADQPYYQVVSWQPSSLFANQEAKSQYAKLYEPVTITVLATTVAGCTDTASLSFDPLPLDYTVLLPNAFTPNGDGRNDIFRPLMNMKRAYTIKYFRIKNRWGTEVFHQIAQNIEGWDGTYKGVPQDMGVYFYFIEIEFVDGHTVNFKGDVMLIR